MSVSLTPSTRCLFNPALEDRRCRFSIQSSPNSLIRFQTSFRRIRSSTSNAYSSVETDFSTELDAVSRFSEIVPDTVVFDDFERFPPTAATVSSSLLLGICSLPDTKFKSAIETALADGECYAQQDSSLRLSCFFNKALVNVGADLVKLVPGRVSTEVDARLAYDTHGIIRKVNELLKLYNEKEIPPERLLFKIPSTWQGIEASRLLECEGIQTHLTFVYCFSQVAAAAQAGASVIQIFVGRLRDWARNHSGDPEIEAACKQGEDPGLALFCCLRTGRRPALVPDTLVPAFRAQFAPIVQLRRNGFTLPKDQVTKAYNYIHKNGYKSRLMAAAIRNKQDIFSLLGVDYIIAPLKILQSLKESVALPDEKYSFLRRLSPTSAAGYNFSKEELVEWDQQSFASGVGPAAEELLGSGLEGYVNQTRRVEEHFGKIWPPPNV